MLQLTYLYLSLVLGGVGLTIAFWFFYRQKTRGKVICYFFNKSRRFYRKALSPTSIGVLEYNGKAFSYDEAHIVYTPAFLFREPFPSLIFNEDKPNPLSLNFFEADIVPMESPDGEISTSELSKILNDGTVRDFVNAQSKINLSQVTGVIVAASAIIICVVVGVGYWIKGMGVGVTP